ncbi:MAG: hypothetical protein IV089_02765 [Thiobacillus sp.]|nr:hypothetical protein [Thiobacillus sp.]
MTDRSPDTQDSQNEATPDDAFNPSRRKLTGAVLGVSAVFTLASRPVLAGQCMSPSAAVSGNLSQHGTPTVCSGLSPGYWKEKPESWPSPYAPGTATNSKVKGPGYTNQVQNWSEGTLFHPIFSGSQFMADLDDNATTAKTSLSMMQVMIMSDGNNPWGLNDPDNLGAHIAAALLNAKAGLTPVLSEVQVINIWNEWALKGYFEPTANVKWTSAQIVEYIKTTFH